MKPDFQKSQSWHKFLNETISDIYVLIWLPAHTDIIAEDCKAGKYGIYVYVHILLFHYLILPGQQSAVKWDGGLLGDYSLQVSHLSQGGETNLYATFYSRVSVPYRIKHIERCNRRRRYILFPELNCSHYVYASYY